jgi:hypothetical protein
MSSPSPTPGRKWTVPILLGALALAVLLVVCIVGSAAAYLAFRGKSPATPQASPSSASPPAPTPAPPRSGAQCLVGDWLEVSHVSNANIFGTDVQLTGKGTLMRFTAAGVNVAVLENLTYTGATRGETFEVIHNGSLTLNYVADDETIHYSNPQATGTTTWKVDGRVKATEPIKASLKPETYRCSGNDLRIFSETSATELTRVVGPGTET